MTTIGWNILVDCKQCLGVGKAILYTASEIWTFSYSTEEISTLQNKI